MRPVLVLLFARSALAAITIACGSPTDTGFAGGAAWPATGAAADRTIMSALPEPYNTLRYSSPPGAAFSYLIVLPPNTTGRYQVKLGFVEPNKTSAGQRIFSVSANGIPVIAGLDIFAVSGLLKPYDQSFQVAAADGRITLTFAPSLGNAVVSAIWVDSVDTTPPTNTQWPCEIALGAGTEGWAPTVYPLLACWNVSGKPRRIARAKCTADTDGQVMDVMLPDSIGELHSLLTAPIPCTGDEGFPLPGASLPDGAWLRIMVRVAEGTSPYGSARQVLAVVVFD